MTLRPTRRSAIAGLALLPFASAFARAQPGPQDIMWRAACLATEQAWADESAALDRIVERGAEAVHERYFAEAITFCEDNLAWCRERARVMGPNPPPYPFIIAFDQSADRAASRLRAFTVQRELWRRLAAEEGLFALSARVDAAEAAEDAAGEGLLDPASGADAALCDRIRARVAPVSPLRTGEVSPPLHSIVAGPPTCVCESDFTAGVFMRRMEQLGYYLTWEGGAHRLFDVGADETPALARRRGRLVACARSVPDIDEDIETYGRPDRAEWSPGPW